MIRALVIGRRKPGRPIPEVVAQVGSALAAAGWTVDEAVVDRKRELRRRSARAVKNGADVVVAVGGDGAVLQVVQSLARTDTALGIIPMGTGNLLAGNLEIPKPVEDAIGVLVHGTRRRIDLGRVTAGGRRRWFAVACGVGFDAEVMEATGTEAKMRVGKLAYVASAVGQAGRFRNARHEIRIDGRRVRTDAAQVFIANFGGMGMAVEPDVPVLPDDGLLDVIGVRASGPIAGLLAGWEALRQGRLGESPEGHAFHSRARRVRVRVRPRRRVETDGSVIGTTPIRVRVRAAALTVIVPAADPRAPAADPLAKAAES